MLDPDQLAAPEDRNERAADGVLEGIDADSLAPMRAVRPHNVTLGRP